MASFDIACPRNLISFTGGFVSEQVCVFVCVCVCMFVCLFMCMYSLVRKTEASMSHDTPC